MSEKREKEIRDICDKVVELFKVINPNVSYELATPEHQCGDEYVVFNIGGGRYNVNITADSQKAMIEDIVEKVACKL